MAFGEYECTCEGDFLGVDCEGGHCDLECGREALLAFKQSGNGIGLESWVAGVHPCGWAGVCCGETGWEYPTGTGQRNFGTCTGTITAGSTYSSCTEGYADTTNPLWCTSGCTFTEGLGCGGTIDPNSVWDSCAEVYFASAANWCGHVGGCTFAAQASTTLSVYNPTCSSRTASGATCTVAVVQSHAMRPPVVVSMRRHLNCDVTHRWTNRAAMLNRPTRSARPMYCGLRRVSKSRGAFRRSRRMLHWSRRLRCTKYNTIDLPFRR